MRTATAGVADRRPLRSRLHDPADSPRRGELAAGLVTAAIAGQLLFAQVTFVAAVALVAVARLSRWRPHWLAATALASLIWLLAVGPASAAAAVGEGARLTSAFLLDAAVHPGRLAHPAAVIASAGRWLPRQLPLALLAATGEAGLALWFAWWRRAPGWRWRPGLVALVRRHVSAAALAAGHTVTADGCAIGLVADTGLVAGLSWAEATHGVLLTGPDADHLGVAVACAALRRRKTVVIVECAAAGLSGVAGPSAVADRVRELATSLGVPVTKPGGAAVGGGTSVGSGGSVGSGASVGSGGSVGGVLGRAVRRRETVLVSSQHADAARQTGRDLARVLGGLRELGLRADCLAWLSGCEVMDPISLSELLALGPVTGTAIVLSTTDPQCAAQLACSAGVVVVSGPVGRDLALALAAPLQYSQPGPDAIGHTGGNDAPLGGATPAARPFEAVADFGADRPGQAVQNLLTCQRGGEFTVLARVRADSAAPRVMPGCRVVPISREHLR